MDPITTAIAAALGQVGAAAIQDAYQGLKQLIQQKWGADSDLADAVDRLEEKPDSKARQAMLQEEVRAAEADQDDALLQAARQVLEQIRAQPGGQQRIEQTVTGNQNVFSGTGDVTVSFGSEAPPPDDAS